MVLLPKQSYRFGEFTLDADQEVLLRSGKPVPLTPKVFDTLMILIENGGRVVRKEELMKRLWPDTFVEEANLSFNVQQIRKALGDNARQPTFIETVSRRGYRFIADLELDPDDRPATGIVETPSSPSTADSNGNVINVDRVAGKRDTPLPLGNIIPAQDTLESKSEIRPRRIAGHLPLVLIGLSVILAAVGWFLWHRFSPGPRPANEAIMVAILPFENLTGDSAQDYFSDGLTEEMIAQLGDVDPAHLRVIARTSVMHYKNSQTPLDQIGRELGVQYVLEGSVRRDADWVRVTAQLIRVSDQSHIWSRQFDREVHGLLVLQRDIGKEIAGQIEVTLEDRKTAAQDPTPPSLSPAEYEAYDLCLKGQYFWNQRTIEGFQQAISYYQRAVDKDPNYARAYVGLANSYALIGGYSGRSMPDLMTKARAAAQKALELDESLAEAHTAMALIVQNYDWDWQAAEREFRRAIELNQNYATAHHWYAEHLMMRGRFDEALAESEQARKLDPLSLIIASDNGAILYYSRQYDRAVDKFRSVKELDPNFSRAQMIFKVYVQQGKFASAFEEISKEHSDGPWYWSQLAYVSGRAGQMVQARHAVSVLEDLNSRSEADAATLVWAYLGTGDNKKALDWLEKAYSQHSDTLTTLRVEPAFDPLRSDPRFQDLLRRVRLDQ